MRHPDGDTPDGWRSGDEQRLDRRTDRTGTVYGRDVAGELATVRESVERVRAARRPTEDVAAWAVADEIVDATTAAADAVAAVDRLPRLQHTPDRAVDRSVRAVLDTVYEGDEPTATRLPVSVDDAVDAGRLVDDDPLAVPLTRETPANWYVLLPWSADRLRAVARSCERLGDRFDAVGAPSLAATYRELGRASEELGALLEWLSTLALWYGPPDELVGADYETVESFARRVVDAVTET